METRFNTNKTAEGIRAAIEEGMKANSRKQSFSIVAESNGARLIIGSDSDVWCCTVGFEARGLCGMKRNAWKDVPGYAERVCNYLVGIMTGCRVPLNF